MNKNFNIITNGHKNVRVASKSEEKAQRKPYFEYKVYFKDNVLFVKKGYIKFMTDSVVAIVEVDNNEEITHNIVLNSITHFSQKEVK